jgi:large subunit ribosomal protein L35
MPKNKSHKGTLKRVRITNTGKVKYKTARGSHLLSNKSGQRKRRLRSLKTLSNSEAKRMSKLLHMRLRGRDQPRAAIKRSPSPEERRAMREEAAQAASS